MNTIDPAAYEGDIVSRLRHWRGLHLAHSGELFEAAADEIERLRLNDAEREAVETAAMEADAHQHSLRAATLRGLLERTAPASDSTCTPEPLSTPAECTLLPEWTSRPYWVDPPSGWRYGFPRLYDPESDGDMTEWIIRHGYPKRLARQGLPCTFTACTDVEEARKMLAIRDGVSGRTQSRW